MKRLNNMLRAMCLLLLLPLAHNIQAQSQYWVGGIRYQINGNSVQVVASNNGAYSGQITIPETVMIEAYSMYDGNYQKPYQVTGIGSGAFRDCTGLTSIELPNSIKTIESNAFYGCTGLTSVNIPKGVNTIGTSAFSYCTSLTSIVLPNSVMSMGDNVFYGCSSLTSVQLPGNVGKLTGTFHSCTSLTTIDIPAMVKELDGTFNGCTSLHEVNLPKSLTRICDNTFDGCAALQHIYLPDQVSHIGARAFAGTGLTSLELPAAVVTLSTDVFYGCDQLTSVTVRNTNPPYMMNRGVFSDATYAAALLYVPEIGVNHYQGSSWWCDFTHLVPRQELNNHYDFELDGIYYLITGPSTVDVTYKDKNYNTYSGAVNVPATVTRDGIAYSVTGVGNYAFYGSLGLTGVALPSSVTVIGGHAFEGCNGLTGIDIPESVVTIGDNAFYGCTGLTQLTIPVNVKTLGTNALANIPVQSLTWNARECWTNGDMTAHDINQVTIGNEVTVLPYDFVSGSSISSVVLPVSLKTICGDAFYNCANLTSLTVPVNVTDIGTNAFRNTGITSLTWNARKCWSNGHQRYYYWEGSYWIISELTIGDEVEVLPDNFVSNATITSLDIPASVKQIGAYAFRECKGLTSIVIPDNIIIIADYAFSACSSATSLTIGKNVAQIAESAFAGLASSLDFIWNARHCENTGLGHSSNNVKHLTIGDEVEYLPKYFCYNTSIESLEIPASVRTIDDGAFSYSYSLTGVTIPDGVTTIGNYAFQGCTNLETATIGNSVAAMGYDVFSNCNALRSLTLKEGVSDIGNYCFQGCYALLDLYIPASVTSIGQNAFKNCTGLESIAVATANTYYDSRDNCNAVLQTSNDSIIVTCKNTVLPNTLTAIPDYAFCNNTELTHMDIPASVKSIGKYAFYGCTNLQDITIPAAVTTIGECAFTSCPSMESMVVENGNTVFDSRDNCNAIIQTASDELISGCKNSVIPGSVTTIGSRAFYRSALTSVNIPESVTTIDPDAFRECAALTTVSMGKHVTKIGTNAFFSCKALTDITLPTTLTSIGYCAFYQCNKLNSIAIPGSVKTIGDKAFYGCSGLTSLSINNGVETIGSWTFANCSGLTSLVIPASVKMIDLYAFYHCSGLTSVVIPASVTSIGDDAFYNCTSLATLTCLAQTPPTISSWTFNPEYRTATLRVPEASLEAYKTADYWKSFVHIEGLTGVGPGDLNGDGRLSINDVTTLIDAILNGDEAALSNPYADVNGDGKVSITDISDLIYMLLNND